MDSHLVVIGAWIAVGLITPLAAGIMHSVFS